MVVDAVSNEKGGEKIVRFEAIEAALASATKKKHGDVIDATLIMGRRRTAMVEVQITGKSDHAGHDH